MIFHNILLLYYINYFFICIGVTGVVDPIEPLACKNFCNKPSTIVPPCLPSFALVDFPPPPPFFTSFFPFPLADVFQEKNVSPSFSLLFCNEILFVYLCHNYRNFMNLLQISKLIGEEMLILQYVVLMILSFPAVWCTLNYFSYK